MGRARIKCVQCGAKNDPADLCRICGKMLPGAEKRRREGIGGLAFDDAVSVEREAWNDYQEGRMSAASRSRRPAALPDAPPATWGVATALLDGADPPPASADAPAPAEAPAAAPPPPATRVAPPKLKGGRGPMVALALVAVAAIAVAGVVYQRQTDPGAKADRDALVAALPVLAGPEGRFAQADLTSYAKSRAGLEIQSASFGACGGLDRYLGDHGTAGASAKNTDGAAGFALDTAMLADASAAHDFFTMATSSVPDCAETVTTSAAGAASATADAHGLVAAGGLVGEGHAAAPEAAPPVGDESSATKLVVAMPTGSMRFDVIVVRAGRAVIMMVATTATPDGSAVDPAVLAGTLQGVTDSLRAHQ